MKNRWKNFIIIISILSLLIATYIIYPHTLINDKKEVIITTQTKVLEKPFIDKISTILAALNLRLNSDKSEIFKKIDINNSNENDKAIKFFSDIISYAFEAKYGDNLKQNAKSSRTAEDVEMIRRVRSAVVRHTRYSKDTRDAKMQGVVVIEFCYDGNG